MTDSDRIAALEQQLREIREQVKCIIGYWHDIQCSQLGNQINKLAELTAQKPERDSRRVEVANQ